MGIWRRRGTPSFWRSTSQCALTVLGEMPSRSDTSLFEQPAAMRTITSRWRSVIGGILSTVAFAMQPRYDDGTRRTIHHRE